MNEEDERMKKTIGILLAAILVLLCLSGLGEQPAASGEQNEEIALKELQPLMEMTEVENTEGLDLEELTEAYANSAMSEYVDGTGLCFQYPSVLVFSEENGSSVAVSEDGAASLWIESLERDAQLTLDNLRSAVSLTSPKAETEILQDIGCLTVRQEGEDRVQIAEIYLLSKNWMHHLTMRYPSDQAETYNTYLSYLVNSLTTQESDLG